MKTIEELKDDLMIMSDAADNYEGKDLYMNGYLQGQQDLSRQIIELVLGMEKKDDTKG